MNSFSKEPRRTLSRKVHSSLKHRLSRACILKNDEEKGKIIERQTQGAEPCG